MRKFLSVIGYITLGLPLALSVLLAFSVRPWALDRSFYKDALNDERLYTALRSPELPASVDKILTIDGIKVDGPALVAAAQKSLPVTELKALSNEAVDKGFDYLEGRTRGERLVLDMKPLKAAITAQSHKIATDYASALAVRAETPAPGDFSFRPASLPLNRAITAAEGEVKTEVAQAPEGVVWPPKDKAASQGLIEGKALSIHSIDMGIASLSAITLLLIGGLSVLGARGASRRLSLAGSYLAIPSVFVLVIGAIGYFAGGSVIAGNLPNELKAIGAGGTTPELAAYFAHLAATMAKSFFVSGLSGVCVGGLLKSLRRTLRPEEIE